jgi:hypothetical protein
LVPIGLVVSEKIKMLKFTDADDNRWQ